MTPACPHCHGTGRAPDETQKPRDFHYAMLEGHPFVTSVEPIDDNGTPGMRTTLRVTLRDGRVIEERGLSRSSCAVNWLIRHHAVLEAVAPLPIREKVPDDMIARVKRVREETHCGLWEAKEAVAATRYDTEAAVRLVRTVDVDRVGRRVRPWTDADVRAALDGAGTKEG